MAIASVKPAHTVEAPLIHPGAAHSTGTLARGSGSASPIGPSAGFPTPTSSSRSRSPWSRSASFNGAPAAAVAKSFGDGFWSLITFTMQMAMVVIGGYVVATSPPAARLIDALARVPRSGRGAVAFVAAEHAHLAAQLGHQPDLLRPAGARAGAARPICAWTIAPPARPPISASARPGRWA